MGLVVKIKFTAFPTGFYEMEGNLRPAGVEELPEEDQEEGELPTLPPGKDPSSHKLTNPLLMKGHTNNKQMVYAIATADIHTARNLCY